MPTERPKQQDRDLRFKIATAFKSVLIRDEKPSLASQIISLCSSEQNDSVVVENIYNFSIASPPLVPILTLSLASLITQKQSLQKDFLNYLHQKTKESMNLRKLNEFKLCLRLISCLYSHKIITVNSLLSLYDNIITYAMKTDKEQYTRSDFFIYCVVASIPWANCGILRIPSEFVGYFDRIDAYMAKRTHSYNILSIWKSENFDYLTVAVNAIGYYVSEENYQSLFINKDSSIVIPFDSIAPIDFPPISFPDFGLTTVFPRNYTLFTIFSHEQSSLPHYERFVIDELVSDTLIIENSDSTITNAIIRSLPLEEDEQKEVVVESVFGRILRLPCPSSSNENASFYGTVLSKLMLSDSVYTDLVLEALEVFCSRLEQLHPTSLVAFAQWFSWHLSNVQFIHDWGEWESVNTMSVYSTKYQILNSIISRAVWLSYPEKVAKSLPVTLKAFSPMKMEPNIPWVNDETKDNDVSQFAKILHDIIGGKSTSTENVIETIKAKNLNPDDALSAFTYALLARGSLSITHLGNSIKRNSAEFAEVVAAVGDNRKAKAIILCAIGVFWSYDLLNLIITIDRFITLSIVSPSDVIDWFFSPKMRQKLAEDIFWDIIDAIIVKAKTNSATNPIGDFFTFLFSNLSNAIQEGKESFKEEEIATAYTRMIESKTIHILHSNFSTLFGQAPQQTASQLMSLFAKNPEIAKTIESLSKLKGVI